MEEKDWNQILADFSATKEAKPNLTKEEWFSKFPEFNNDDKLLQAAYDYDATVKSGKYKDDQKTLQSKFPEFWGGQAKQQPTRYQLPTFQPYQRELDDSPASILSPTQLKIARGEIGEGDTYTLQPGEDIEAFTPLPNFTIEQTEEERQQRQQQPKPQRQTMRDGGRMLGHNAALTKLAKDNGIATDGFENLNELGEDAMKIYALTPQGKADKQNMDNAAELAYDDFTADYLKNGSDQDIKAQLELGRQKQILEQENAALAKDIEAWNAHPGTEQQLNALNARIRDLNKRIGEYEEAVAQSDKAQEKVNEAFQKWLENDDYYKAVAKQYEQNYEATMGEWFDDAATPLYMQMTKDEIAKMKAYLDDESLNLDYRQRTAIKRRVRDAEAWVKAAEKNGWLDKTFAGMQRKGAGIDIATMFRGMGNSLTLDRLSFGIGDALDARAIEKAMVKVRDQGVESLTPEERALLESDAVLDLTKSMFNVDESAFNAGATTMEMLPFIAELWLSGGALGAIKGGVKAAVKGGAKGFGKGLRAGWKAAMKPTASQLGRLGEAGRFAPKTVGQVAKEVGMTAAEIVDNGLFYAMTTGLGHSVANTLEYMTPEMDSKYDFGTGKWDIKGIAVDEQGNIKGGDKLGLAALKGFGMQAIEGGSEMLGEKALQPLLDRGGYWLRGMMGKQGRAMYKPYLRVVDDWIGHGVLKNVSGFGTEYAEELAGSVARVITGLSTWDQEFNKQNLADTAYGLMPAQVAFAVLGGGRMVGQARRSSQAKDLLDKYAPEQAAFYDRVAQMSTYDGADMLDRKTLEILKSIDEKKNNGTLTDEDQRKAAAELGMIFTMQEQIYMDEASAYMKDKQGRRTYEGITSNLNENGMFTVYEWKHDGTTERVPVLSTKDGKATIRLWNGKKQTVDLKDLSFVGEYTPEQAMQFAGERQTEFDDYAYRDQTTPMAGSVYYDAEGNIPIVPGKGEVNVTEVADNGDVTFTTEDGTTQTMNERKFYDYMRALRDVYEVTAGQLAAWRVEADTKGKTAAENDDPQAHYGVGREARMARRALANAIGEERMTELERMDGEQLTREYMMADEKTQDLMYDWMQNRVNDSYANGMNQRRQQAIAQWKQRIGRLPYDNGNCTTAVHNDNIVIVEDNDGKQAAIVDIQGNKSMVQSSELSNMQDNSLDSVAAQATMPQQAQLTALEQAYNGTTFQAGQEYTIGTDTNGEEKKAIVVSVNEDGTISYATEYGYDKEGNPTPAARSIKVATAEGFRDMTENARQQRATQEQGRQEAAQQRADMGELHNGQRVTIMDGGHPVQGTVNMPYTGSQSVFTDTQKLIKFDTIDDLKKSMQDAANALQAEQQAAIEAVANRINELANAMPNASIKVVTDINELRPDAQELARKGQLEAYFDPDTNTVVFYAPGLVANNSNVDGKVIHEVVIHYGLRNMLGKKDYAALCLNIFNNVMDDNDRAQYVQYVKDSHPDWQKTMTNAQIMEIAADEWLAFTYENRDIDSIKRESLLQTIVNFIVDLFKKAGVDLNREEVMAELDQLVAASRDWLRGEQMNQEEKKEEAPKEEEKKEEPQPEPTKTREELIANAVQAAANFAAQGDPNFVKDNLDKAKKRVSNAKKRKPTSTDPAKRQEQIEKINTELAAAESELAFWNDVQAVINEAQLAGQTRLNEADQALKDLDTNLNPTVEAEEVHKFDKEPANADEAAADFLVGFVKKEHRINEQSLMQETNWSEDEVKNFRPATTPDGGMTLQEAAENLYNEYESEGSEHGWFKDPSEARDKLVSVMQEAGKYGELANYINQRRGNDEATQQMQAALDANAQQLGYEDANDMHDKRMAEAQAKLEELKDEQGNLSEEALQQFKDFTQGLMIGQEETTTEQPTESIEVGEEFIQPTNEEAPFSVTRGTRYSVVNANQAIFVSNAARAVEGIKQEKATPEQWLKMVEKNGGLKAGEDKWLGLSQWLKDSKAKTLTKQEVLDFINENAIKIEETHYSEIADVENNERMKALNDEFLDLVSQGDEETGSIYVADWADWAFDAMEKRYGDDFRSGFTWDYDDFRFPKLVPAYEYGGDELTGEARYYLGIEDNPINSTRLDYTTYGLENKREIALTVPTIESWNESDEVHFGDAGEGRAIAWIRFGDAYARGNAVTEQQSLFRELSQKYDCPPYALRERASKEDIARLDAVEEKMKKEYKNNGYGKVLVIDEIQSKRHQEGREKGYGDTDTASLEKKRRDALKAYDDYIEELKEKYGVEVGILNYITQEETEKVDRLNEEINAAAVAAQKASTEVPAAPFEKNWMELSMKRMLRLAAEEGYDKVAWTTGEQQAKRYNIGKVVDAMEVRPYKAQSPSESDGHDLTVHLSEGTTWEMFVQPDGTLNSDNELFDGKNVTEVFGKELGNRIMGVTEPVLRLDNEDLLVGGEGMKGFYDKMIPSFMNKYGKQWGVKVGEVTMPNLEEGYQTMHSIDVNDAIKESVMSGQLMFSIVSPESQAIFDKAKEIFGTTNNINEAGYILPDGAMLDFSGRRTLDEGTDDGFLRGRRTEDHRDIQQIEYEKDGNTPSGVNTDMPDFIRRGAIRIDSNAGVINLAVKPTQQQRWPIRRIVEANDGDVQVDFGDGWDSDHYVEYDGAKPSRVLADIDRYFDEGIKPEGNMMFSIVGQVINRNGDINYEKLDNIIRSQRNELAGLSRIPEEAVGRAVATPAIAAEAIARGVRQANLAEVWGEDRTREHTRELIKQWAKQSGHWYDEARLTEDATEGRGGTESRVFVTNNGKTVRKLTSPVFSQGDVEPYIESLHLFGNVFGESAYDIKGFGENDKGELCVVIEQPYIQGVRLSDSGITKSIDKIREFMESLGFKEYGVSMFENDKYRVEDVNRTNVIVDANGDFHVIDAYVSLADESLYKEEPMFSFVGRSGAQRLDMADRAMTRLNNLHVAREMEEQGKDAKTVKMATGWERGKDGKWRYEISDENYHFDSSGLTKFWRENPVPNDMRDLVLKKGRTEEETKKLEAYIKERQEKMKDFMDHQLVVTLEDVVAHDELFNAYPQLKNIKVTITDTNSNNFDRSKGTLYGYYDDGNKEIVINKALRNSEKRSTIIHEIQHAIQAIEGFAKGGNPSFVARAVKDMDNNAQIWGYKLALDEAAEEHPEHAGDHDALLNDILDGLTEEQAISQGWIPDKNLRAQGYKIYEGRIKGDSYEKSYKQWYDKLREAGRTNFFEGTPFDLYKRLAGETEARNVQTRLGFTDEQRRQLLAAETEDVAREDQLVMFAGDPVLYSVSQAANTPQERLRLYDAMVGTKEVSKFVGRVTEGFYQGVVDGAIPLKRLQDVIAGRGKVTDSENAYLMEIARAARAKRLTDEAEEKYYEPMMKAIAALTGRTSKKGYYKAMRDVELYVLAKSGLERNQWFWDEAKKSDPNAQLEDKSGLTALAAEFGEKDFTAFAERLVTDYEARHGQQKIDELWKCINAVSKNILDTELDGHLISQELHDDLLNRWKFYVPMRGFDEQVTSAFYAYQPSSATIRFENPFKKIKGRVSLADNPFVNLIRMTESAINLKGKNEVGLALLNLAASHEDNGLLRVGKAWDVKEVDPATGEVTWKAAYPNLSNVSQADIPAAIDAFQKAMMRQAKTGDARPSSRTAGGVRIHPSDIDQHVLKVKVGGQTVDLYLLGNPKAFQALNPTGKSKAGEKLSGLTRSLSGLMTTYNPVFMVRNSIRDFKTAAIITYTRDGAAGMFNMMGQWFGNMNALRKLISGKSSGDATLDRYWQEFLEFGGETGFTRSLNMEKQREDFNKKMFNLTRDKSGQAMHKITHWYFDWMEKRGNRYAEDITRFAVFCASRKQGRSAMQAAADAKNTTANFNKKGQSGFARFMSTNFAFFNAAIQGLNTSFHAFKDNPGRAATAAVSTMIYSMAIPFVNMCLLALFGDDDDWRQYENMTQFVSNTHAVYYIPGAGFLTMPYPQDFVPFTSLGNIIWRNAAGFEKPLNGRSIFGNVMLQWFDTWADLLPVNAFEEGFGEMKDWKGVARALAPTWLSPVADVMLNRNFMGSQIRRKHFTLNDQKDLAPYWAEYDRSKNWWAHDIARLIAGGDEYRAGAAWRNVDPRQIIHLVEGYGGGTVKLVSDIAVYFEEMAKGDKPTLNQAPFIKKFWIQPNPDKYEGNLNGKLYEMAKYQRELEQQIKDLQKEADKAHEDGNDKAAEKREKKIEEIQNSMEYKILIDYDVNGMMKDWRDERNGITNDETLSEEGKQDKIVTLTYRKAAFLDGIWEELFLGEEAPKQNWFSDFYRDASTEAYTHNRKEGE